MPFSLPMLTHPKALPIRLHRRNPVSQFHPPIRRWYWIPTFQETRRPQSPQKGAIHFSSTFIFRFIVSILHH